MALLDVRDVGVQFGGIVALSDLTFEVEAGRICALIGPNGAGKTTLFNVISRLYEATRGRVFFDGKDLLAQPPHRIAKLGIARTFQNVALFPALTVLENVMTGSFSRGFRRERAVRAEAMQILERLGLESVAHHPATALPYGTLKRVEMARALTSSPRLLMLDEPATGLTHSEVDVLAETIREIRDEFDVTILLVEHHMAMVMGISDHVVVLDFGSKIAEGVPADISNDPRVIEAYLGTSA